MFTWKRAMLAAGVLATAAAVVVLGKAIMDALGDPILPEDAVE